MRIVVAGGSGLIGQALVRELTASGVDVVRLVRRAAGTGEVSWDPGRRWLPPGALEGAAAVVNLSGAGVGDRRWTPAYRAEIRDSRVNATATLATAIAGTTPRPTFISASAIGYYGDTGDRLVDEQGPAGEGFLSDVVVDWEAATTPARDAGSRVVLARTGLVMSAAGGALARMLPIFRAGLGGRLGSGKQWWSCISRRDEVRALRHLLDDASLSGPVNLTGPTPARNSEVTRALGALLGRPTPAPVPALALRTVLGGFSVEVLGSTRVAPSRLLDSGFRFNDATVEAILASGLRDP